MVTDATEVLSEAGVPADRIHRELFWVDEAPPDPVRADPRPTPAAPHQRRPDDVTPTEGRPPMPVGLGGGAARRRPARGAGRAAPAHRDAAGDGSRGTSTCTVTGPWPVPTRTV